MLQTSITTENNEPCWDTDAAVAPPGQCRVASGTRADLRFSWRCFSFATCALSLLLGACALEGRPAWEQAVLMRAPLPPTSADRPARRTAAVKVGDSQSETKLQSARPASRAPVKRVDVPPSAAVAEPHVPLVSIAPSRAAGKTIAALTPARELWAQRADRGWAGVESYSTRHEDTLLDLAVNNNLGFIELVMANPSIDPWLPGEGTEIVLPKLHLPPDGPGRGIVLNLPEQRLYLYEDGRLLRSFPVGIGRDGHATPTGRTSIVRKQVNPTWFPTASARNDDPDLPAAVPPGPDNPLGDRAMYLGWSKYLIHGTNKEYGIGRRASRGCIRMYSDDVVELYNRVSVGTPVTVVNQPTKIGWLGTELYIEASPTMSQVRQWEEKGKIDAVGAGDIRRLVLNKAGAESSRIDWAAVDRAVRERRGIVTRIASAPPLIAIKSRQGDDSSGFVGWLRRQLSSAEF
jgi:L,D-transpeptidase ErfK/SrfK